MSETGTNGSNLNYINYIDITIITIYRDKIAGSPESCTPYFRTDVKKYLPTRQRLAKPRSLSALEQYLRHNTSTGHRALSIEQYQYM